MDLTEGEDIKKRWQEYTEDEMINYVNLKKSIQSHRYYGFTIRSTEELMLLNCGVGEDS